MHRQLEQGSRIDPALEVDHFVDGSPVIDPTPTVELRRRRQVQAQTLLAGQESKQEPALFLADTDRVAGLSDVTLRQSVGDPIAGDAQHLDVRSLEPELLVELTEHRRLGRLMGMDATLRKLPTTPTGATCEEQPTGVIGQDDPDIGTETVFVDIVGVHENLFWHQFFHIRGRPTTGSMHLSSRGDPRSAMMGAELLCGGYPAVAAGTR